MIQRRWRIAIACGFGLVTVGLAWAVVRSLVLDPSPGGEEMWADLAPYSEAIPLCLGLLSGLLTYRVIPTRGWLLVACLLFLPMVALVMLYLAIGYPFVTAKLQSTSPDGIYKIKLTERSHTGQSGGWIELFESPVESESWRSVRVDRFYNDSLSRSGYAVDWQFDAVKKTTGVTVFGDFGLPPHVGTVVLQLQFDSATNAWTTSQEAP